MNEIEPSKISGVDRRLTTSADFGDDEIFEFSESVTRDFLPHYRLEWEQKEASWSAEPTYRTLDKSDVAYRPFENCELISFNIIAPNSTLKTLKLIIGTYDQRNDANLFTEVLDKSGTVLARSIISLKDLPNNQFSPIVDLDGSLFDVGEKYTIRMFWLGESQCRIAVHGLRLRRGLGRYGLHRRLDRLSDRRLFVPRADQGIVPREFDKAVLIVPELVFDQIHNLTDPVLGSFPGVEFQVIAFDEIVRRLEELRSANIVVFASVFQAQSHEGLRVDELCFDLHRHGVCTVFFDNQSLPFRTMPKLSWGRAASTELGHRWQQARRCHFIVEGGSALTLVSTPSNSRPTWLGDAHLDHFSPALLSSLVTAVRSPATPRIAIVARLDARSETVETFLDCVAAQTYPGEITVVLVEDEPRESGSRTRAFAQRLALSGVSNRQVNVLAAGTRRVKDKRWLVDVIGRDTDIVLVIDSDCLINRDFVAAHVFEHWWDDVDVVIGRTTIDSGERNSLKLLEDIETQPSRLAVECEPEDPILPESFINFGTALFSIKKRFLDDNSLFDESENYTSSSEFGRDWNAIESGFRLYQKGGVVRFTDKAFAVRDLRVPRISPIDRWTTSMRNFASLLDRNPDLALVARRWASDLYRRLVAGQKELDSHAAPERRRLDALFATGSEKASSRPRSARRTHKTLRVLTYRWHAAHQYEIYKLPHEFTLATGHGPSLTSHWGFDQRPLRPNARLAAAQYVDPRDFDVVLLHFDENVLASDLSNENLPADWGDAFNWALGIADLPKIAVCHGTPAFVGQYAADPAPKTSFTVHEAARQFLVDRLADAKAKVVCNSHQAHMEWGFADSQVIWHGFDPQEFPPATLERDVLSLDADEARPHYRGAWELDAIKALLGREISVETASHDGAAIEDRSQNPFAVRQFRAYVDRIRQFKIYLNTTLRSPMPRSRGEAMMTGVIPVSLRNHDVDRFIDNGVDGFYADQPRDLAEFIIELLRDEARVRAMSAAARRKALDLFNHDRYLAQWDALLREVCG